MTKLKAKPIRPRSAIAIIIANQPAKARADVFQDCDSLLASLPKGEKDANIRQDAKSTSPMPSQSGKNPDPGPTSET
jgi:hypothetical protein